MARKKDEKLAKARKLEILNAAANCFVRHGLHQASMRQICAEANLSAGAVYNYFPSKHAIIEAMAEQEKTEIGELAEYLAKSKNCYKAVRQAVKWIVEETTQADAQLQIELLAESQRNEDVRHHFEANEQAISDALTTTILRGQELKQITKKKSASSLVSIITALYEGYLGRIATTSDKDRKDMIKNIDYSLERILQP